VTVRVGISRAALRARLKWILTTLALAVAGCALIGTAVALADVHFAIAGFLVFLLAVPTYLWGVRLVTVHKIDDGLIWLDGVNRDYLAGLPNRRQD
jgi:hypothetical protein